MTERAEGYTYGWVDPRKLNSEELVEHWNSLSSQKVEVVSGRIVAVPHKEEGYYD
jgi:hypothetical protein